MKKNVFILLVLLMTSMATYAQKPKIRVQKKNKTSVTEEAPAATLFTSMLPSTAKVMFIDSLVVDKSDFLSKIPLNKESGAVFPYDTFFISDSQPHDALYQNEFGNRCYFSKTDTLYGGQLYVSDKIGDSWTTPQPLNGLGEEIQEPNYPFMMADGITLFFSAKGKGSMGGYDIFMTIFDSESDKFYKPENYGLPYNSTANDYFIAYDDLDTLGWLVSDRYQPEGKVCIYTFVPTYPRMGFDHDALTTPQLTNYARLTSIKDTWHFGNRKNALERLENMLKRNAKKKDNETVCFVVNDNVTYTSLDDFRSPSNRQMYIKLQDMKRMLNENEQNLENKRSAYHNATSNMKREMADGLIREEKEIEQQRENVKMTEKNIRNTENILRK